MITIVGGTPDLWGFIPTFLDEGDPRPAKDQFDDHYLGGFNHFDGFTLDPMTYRLSYPGDPPMKPLSVLMFRNERLIMYDFSWVVIMQPDRTWQVARMD